MKLYFLIAKFLLVTFLIEVTEQSGQCQCTHLRTCLTKTINGYTAPMIPCFNKCALILGSHGQHAATCFDSNHPNKYGEGVDCFLNEAGCPKRYRRSSLWDHQERIYDFIDEDEDDEDIDEEHLRVARAANTTRPVPTDMFVRVIFQSVNDHVIKTRLVNYRKCKIQCYFSYHGVKYNANRPRRQVAQKSQTGHGSEKFFNMFGSCYNNTNCPGNVEADKCMPRFFTKRDPKVFCGCLQNFYGQQTVNCEKTYSEPNVKKDNGGEGLHSHPSISIANRPS